MRSNKISSEKICSNLENLQKLYPKQYKIVYILGKQMKNHLAKIHKIDAGYFIAAVLLSVKDLHKIKRNKFLREIKGKRLLDYTPDIADKVCNRELAERVRKVYSKICQNLIY